MRGLATKRAARLVSPPPKPVGPSAPPPRPVARPSLDEVVVGGADEGEQRRVRTGTAAAILCHSPADPEPLACASWVPRLGPPRAMRRGVGLGCAGSKGCRSARPTPAMAAGQGRWVSVEACSSLDPARLPARQARKRRLVCWWCASRLQASPIEADGQSMATARGPRRAARRALPPAPRRRPGFEGFGGFAREGAKIPSLSYTALGTTTRCALSASSSL